MSDPTNICVLLGGPSAEREVSLRSGAAVARALRSVGYAVTEVDPAEPWTLPTGTDVVFLALHGTYGEDGTVQQVLEQLRVPYTGCGVEASRVAFDKVLTKRRLVACGVPTAPFVVVNRRDTPWPAGWQPPVILKPVRQGSSVGLQFVDQEGQWSAALTECLSHDTEALVEERIRGREVTVGVFDDQALPVVEVRPRQGGYDYRNKYTQGATEYLCPAPFDGATTAALQDAGLRAFRAIGGRDYGRVDVMVRENGEPVVLEVNTLPGMTETSLLPKAAAAAGMDFSTLCRRMVELAWRRPAMRSELESNHVA
ncbi:MAG: D-alanine--D-alanine ligase [Verrucomicrobiales bacterium]|nr:D-alanine--D-alanine ligase [Verrucomicrobiales bacterium]